MENLIKKIKRENKIIWIFDAFMAVLVIISIVLIFVL